MKADTTRSTFKASKHYNRVLMQQGRVQLDADWNEQNDIVGHRIDTESVDIIGNCGAPMHDAGFHIVAKASELTVPQESTLPENQNPPSVSPGDLLISGGRYYVDGILCENDQIVTYTNQPDLPDATPIAQAGTYLAYLDVWSRHITALEDSSIREVALNGPDTATRAKTIWQVKLFRVGDINLAADCSSKFTPWNDEIAAGTGKLAARAQVGATSNNPCIVEPGGGYRRLENQHYRVEVHDGGALGTATFKWSRDNGAIVSRWESQNVNDLTVSSIGRDKVLSFAVGQWVELIDDTCELLGKPGTLVKLTKVEGNVITIDPATATGATTFASFPRNPRVRRWDMVSILKPANQGWQDLEDGVQVHFTNDSYKTGDYWLIPARTATADVEWPTDPNTNQPATLLPFGIQHHYCRLAILKNDGTNWTTKTDCRNIFPPLTELIDFFYLGGDGQEAMPDLANPSQLTKLAEPLECGVTNGEWPVAGATVRFTVTKGNGQLTGSVTQLSATTGANGVAQCDWSIDSSTPSQQVEAVLLDDAGNPICLPIHFSANPSIASQVAYDPGQVCASLQGQTTVQKAIDTLASLTSLYSVSGDDQSVLPTETLDPLVVIAASECGPVDNMTVVFSVISGGGQVAPDGGGPPGPTATVITKAGGLAKCDWTLGAAPGAQVVEAVLQPNPNPVVPPLSVRFNAEVRSPGTADPGIHVTSLTVLSTAAALANDMDLPKSALTKGIQIQCDQEIAPNSLKQKHPSENPVCIVSVDIPYPFTPADADFYKTKPACFQTVILGAKAEAKTNNIIWAPTADAMTWLNAVFAKLSQAQANLHLPIRLLTRLALKGNFIWSKKDQSIFLDGELFLANSQSQLHFPSGDQHRGGNLEMWFWLVQDKPS
jgi:Family of unknown function (DUF6519)